MSQVQAYDVLGGTLIPLVGRALSIFAKAQKTSFQNVTGRKIDNLLFIFIEMSNYELLALVRSETSRFAVSTSHRCVDLYVGMFLTTKCVEVRKTA